MDLIEKVGGKRYTRVFLQGYARGTETGESYEEFLLFSEQLPARANLLSSYSSHVAQLSPDTVCFVSTLKTLRERQSIEPFLKSLGLTIDYWAF